jgi:CRISPR-associated protein Cas1
MGKNHPLRRAQYARASDGEFCVSFARAIATAKVGNSISLARRWSRQLHEDGVEPAPNILASAIACYARLATARDLNELRGLEGAAGCQYYRVLRMMLRPCWSFERRTRRPPADPVNALLSICYTLLTQAAVSALEVVGLDPFEGFYHGDKYGRPALALDLVEEFRAYVADSLTLRLINRRMVELRDFGTRAGGVILSPRGWSVVLTQFGRRMNEEILVRDIDRRLSVRKIIEFQARRIARVVQGKDEHYKPFRTR